MNKLSKLRMIVLRFTYLLIALWLLFMIWPTLVHHDDTFALSSAGVHYSLLGAVQLMAIVGFIWPIKMLPLLLFELVWKLIWLFTIGLPLYINHRTNTWAIDTIWACIIGVCICVIAIPWRYLFMRYFTVSSDN